MCSTSAPPPTHTGTLHKHSQPDVFNLCTSSALPCSGIGGSGDADPARLGNASAVCCWVGDGVMMEIPPPPASMA